MIYGLTQTVSCRVYPGRRVSLRYQCYIRPGQTVIYKIFCNQDGIHGR